MSDHDVADEHYLCDGCGQLSLVHGICPPCNKAYRRSEYLEYLREDVSRVIAGNDSGFYRLGFDPHKIDFTNLRRWFSNWRTRA